MKVCHASLFSKKTFERPRSKKAELTPKARRFQLLPAERILSNVRRMKKLTKHINFLTFFSCHMRFETAIALGRKANKQLCQIVN